jgi:hypothetical protein
MQPIQNTWEEPPTGLFVIYLFTIREQQIGFKAQDFPQQILSYLFCYRKIIAFLQGMTSYKLITVD